MERHVSKFCETRRISLVNQTILIREYLWKGGLDPALACCFSEATEVVPYSYYIKYDFGD